MKISLFGKDLFEVKKSTGVAIYNTAADSLKKSDYLIDFYKDTGGSSWANDVLSTYVIAEPVPASGAAVLIPKGDNPKPEPKKEELTPKGVYNLKMLNDDSFVLKADPTYIDEQLALFTEKLSMVKTSEFDMNRGTTEIASILSRFENRKKYAEFKDFYDQFPYTSTTKISELTKNHSYLQLGQVAQFVADMPKEAMDIMKKYTEQTKKLCEKKPVFYIIANKKDFQKTEKRRDPILLAQSPFGHVWNILGAWDDELLILSEL